MSHVIGSGVPGNAHHYTLFVGFESALEFWRNDSNLGLYTDCIDANGRLIFSEGFDLSEAATHAAHISDWSVSLFSERKLDLMVPYGARTDCPLVQLHQVGWKLPRHSFVQAREGVLVASPELVFLQAAARYRGAGLQNPQLNVRRETTELQAETIGSHTYFYDARWSGRLRSGRRYSVGCEVDSNAHHFNNPADVKADAIRRDNVQFMSCTHIPITSDELADANLLMKKVLMIAKHIGQRIRRYPRRDTAEEQEAFESEWAKRIERLDDLLKELASDAHPPRPRPKELKILKSGLPK